MCHFQLFEFHDACTYAASEQMTTNHVVSALYSEYMLYRLQQEGDFHPTSTRGMMGTNTCGIQLEQSTFQLENLSVTKTGVGRNRREKMTRVSTRKGRSFQLGTESGRI